MLIFGSIVSCVSETGENGGKDKGPVHKPIGEVLKGHTAMLMSIPGVLGTAQSLCDGQPCIKVYVIKKTLELEQKIPSIIGGYPVVMKETGKIQALPDNKIDSSK